MSGPDMSAQLEIVTAEGVTLHLPLAGPVARALAWIVDLILVFGVIQLVGSIAGALGQVLPALSTLLGMLTGFAVLILYAAVLEWRWRGQTVGKRVLGLRVADAHGLPLLGTQVLIRNLLRAVDDLPAAYLVGGVSCLFSRHAQRLGDRVAGTVVVRTAAAQAPDAALWQTGKYNTLTRYPQHVMRLRERARPAEAQLLLDALERRDWLPPAERLLLFRDLADYFQSRERFPAQAVEALSAEQYLRNVAAVLFAQAVTTSAVTAPAR